MLPKDQNYHPIPSATYEAKHRKQLNKIWKHHTTVLYVTDGYTHITVVLTHLSNVNDYVQYARAQEREKGGESGSL